MRSKLKKNHISGKGKETSAMIVENDERKITCMTSTFMIFVNEDETMPGYLKSRRNCFVLFLQIYIMRNQHLTSNTDGKFVEQFLDFAGNICWSLSETITIYTRV